MIKNKCGSHYIGAIYNFFFMQKKRMKKFLIIFVMTEDKYVKHYQKKGIFMKKRKLNIHPYYLLMCLVLAAVSVSFLFATFDDDILWHYKLGEEIIRNKSISMVDSFSWQENLQWIQHEWLYDILIYFVLSIGGMTGYILLYMLGMFCLFYFGGFINKCKSKIGYLFVAIVSCVAIPKNTGNRPSEFSIWLIVAFIYLYRKEINYKFKYILWFILGVFAANFHGGIIATSCILLFILFAVDFFWDVRDYLYKKKFDVKRFLLRFAQIPVLFIGALINPGGVHLHIASLKGPFLETSRHISEWQPWKMNYFSAFWVVLIIFTMGYSFYKYGLTRKNAQIVALCCATAILSFSSARGGLVFLYVWLLFAYPYFEELVKDVYGSSSKFTWRPGVPAAIISAAVLVYCILSNQPFNQTFYEYAMTGRSQKVFDYMKENVDGKILNAYSDGNFLIYNDIKCFIDSRQWPYAKEMGNNSSVDDYLDATENGFDNLFEKYNFEYVYCTEELDIKKYLSERNDYEIVIEDSETNESIWKRK